MRKSFTTKKSHSFKNADLVVSWVIPLSERFVHATWFNRVGIVFRPIGILCNRSTMM